DIDLTVEPVRNPQFVTLSDGAVRNTYTLRIRNLSPEDRTFRILLSSDAILRIGVETDGPHAGHVIVPANETLQARVYVTARPQDPAAATETTDLRLWVEDVESDDRSGVATIFNGKG
ncbi:MAG: FixG Ig-like domain-containing protein, partial [Pseudomonadota bacterium]